MSATVSQVLARVREAQGIAADMLGQVREEGLIKFGAVRSALDAAELELAAAAETGMPAATAPAVDTLPAAS